MLFKQYLGSFVIFLEISNLPIYNSEPSLSWRFTIKVMGRCSIGKVKLSPKRLAQLFRTGLKVLSLASLTLDESIIIILDEFSCGTLQRSLLSLIWRTFSFILVYVLTKIWIIKNSGNVKLSGWSRLLILETKSQDLSKLHWQKEVSLNFETVNSFGPFILKLKAN